MQRCRAIALPLLALCASAPAVAATTAAQVLPTVYEAGHFFAVPETTSGQRIKLLVDTGGGGGQARLYWISAATAQRLHLATHMCRLGKDYSISVATLPRYAPGRGLPPPQGGPCGDVVMVQPKGLDDADGQFSGSYFYGAGTWTFNYPDRKLILQGTSWQPEPAAHAASLGFQRNDRGRATFGYARIEIRVGGETLPMLLDTGATAHPTPAGEKASGTPTINGEGVTSYIVKSIFERWHREHPDWKVVKDGDDLFGPSHPMPIIEVPKVEIAGWSVGPVWFTERPDAAFHVMMAEMMDEPVEGSAGANIFRHFVMTIDYPKATAYFRCVRGCKAATPPRAP